MKNSIKISFVITLFFLSITACNKSEGTGGRATIKGKIKAKYTDTLGQVVDSYGAQMHDVFIIYGDDNDTYNDDFETSHDGSFEFNFLNKGNYEIFTFSECSSCEKGQDSLILIPVTIENSREIVDLGEITIEAEGRATIKGKITVNNVNVLGQVVNSYGAQMHDVFIIYGNNDETYDDDFETSHDGSFEFNFLNKGNYEIFTFSECVSCAKGQDSLILIPATIEHSRDTIDIGEIIIINNV